MKQVESRKGKIRQMVVTEEVEDAFEFWWDRRASLLRECGLAVFSNEEGERYYDFATSMDAERVRADLEDSLTDYEQFERLCHSGILFRPETPPKAIRQIIDLADKMANAHPGSYDKTWLIRTIVQFEQENPELNLPDSQADSSSAPPPMLARLIEQFNEAMRQGKESHVYPRFGDLCSKLYINAKSRQAVVSLLQLLITGSKGVGRAPAIALRLIRRLRETPDFDYYEWLKRVLEKRSSDLAPGRAERPCPRGERGVERVRQGYRTTLPLPPHPAG